MPFTVAYLGEEHIVRNFHVPLPEQTYALLRAEAERTQVSATTLAREAIDSWLNYRARKARHAAIAAYAAEMAGTDLDPDLEAAGIEHLVKTGQVRERSAEMSTGLIAFQDVRTEHQFDAFDAKDE
jgi:hypothetical protein